MELSRVGATFSPVLDRASSRDSDLSDRIAANGDPTAGPRRDSKSRTGD